jgi:spore coat protein A, manganese oxidase
MLTRRNALSLGLVAGGATLLPVGPLVQLARGDGPTTPPTAPFARDLTVPPVAVPVPGGDPAVDSYQVTLQPASLQILDGPATPIWTYGGTLPGPTVLARAGRTVAVTQTNGLPVPFTTHHHGAVVNGDSDGHPSDLVPPGGSKTYVLPNRTVSDGAQMTARTMWYHDHSDGVTGRNVYSGLAGFYLLRDPADPTDAALPQGPYDVPLVFQDRTINPDGRLNYPFPMAADNGVLGDVVLVNGTIQPRMAVDRALYRFRLLDGSNARQYQFALSNGQPLVVIATEGGFLGRPVSVASLFVAQAERYEVVVDFRGVPAGSSVFLLNRLGETPRLRSLLRFDVGSRVVDSGTVPPVLREIAPIPLTGPVLRRSFEFARKHGQFEINGAAFADAVIDFTVRSGATEVWTLKNGGGWVHPVHVHLLNFQVLDRDGKPPRPEERGWKETVFLPPGSTARVAMTWPDLPADGLGRPAGPFRDRYVFHCHNLEHEDRDMMLQFRVLPGQ